MMHEHRKSDIAIVAEKPANKAERSAAELGRRRSGRKRNGDQGPRYWTQSHAAGNSTSTRVTTADHMRVGAKALDRSTRGRSRMRERCMSGSVRGARGNLRPYRDRACREPTTYSNVRK